MARLFYLDAHPELAPWAERLREFAAQSDDEAAYLRRAGRYVLWCEQNGFDPTEGDRNRVSLYLDTVRTLRDGKPFAERTKKEARLCIEGWHDWPQPS